MVVMQPSDEKKNPLISEQLEAEKSHFMLTGLSQRQAKLKPWICTLDPLTVLSVEIMPKRVPVKRQ